jgi:hypothetical protein
MAVFNTVGEENGYLLDENRMEKRRPPPSRADCPPLGERFIQITPVMSASRQQSRNPSQAENRAKGNSIRHSGTNLFRELPNNQQACLAAYRLKRTVL